MNKIWSELPFLLPLGMLLSVAALGQSTPTRSDAQQPSVNLPFFVTDRDNSPVTDIKQGDLTILERKTPRSMLSLKRGSELPLRLGVLIDTSSSERWSSLYKPEVKAAESLLHQILIGLNDRVFVAGFSAFPQKPSEFMNKDQFLTYKVDLTPGGGTAIFDAIAFACKQRMNVDAAQPARRVLILLSDGEDNLSHITHKDAVAAALEAGVVIFAVSTGDDSRSRTMNDTGSTRLKEFAEATGGDSFLHLRARDVDTVFSVILGQIETMYSVGFDPLEPGKKGFHSIELKLSTPDKTRVRAARGYYVK